MITATEELHGGAVAPSLVDALQAWEQELRRISGFLPDDPTSAESAARHVAHEINRAFVEHPEARSTLAPLLARAELVLASGRAASTRWLAQSAQRGQTLHE